MRALHTDAGDYDNKKEAALAASKAAYGLGKDGHLAAIAAHEEALKASPPTNGAISKHVKAKAAHREEIKKLR